MGTAGITITTELNRYDAVIFIGAMQRGGKPGTLYAFDVNDVESLSVEMSADLVRFGLHETRLKELLVFVKIIGTLPRKVVIVGYEPENLELGLKLSPKVEDAVKKLLI